MLTAKPGGFRYFVELSFNGTSFHGWQIQPGVDTVQETINRAIGTIVRQTVNLVGCGRTDAGVHASHFVAHFDVEQPVIDCNQLTYRLNRFFHGSIRIDRIVPVDCDTHARFNAVSRTYHYLISTGNHPFMKDFSWEYTLPLNVAAMNQGAAFLTGLHDFTSFSKLHTDVKTNNCEVYEAFWFEQDGFLVFKIRADRFLRNMVRAAVGTLVEVGRGKSDPTDVAKILAAKDRSEAGVSVPARGLYLTRVDYDPEVFGVNPKSPFSSWF